MYLVAEILHLVHGIRNFPEVLYKKVILKNFTKFSNKHKKQSSGGVLSKDVDKTFANFAGKNLQSVSSYFETFLMFYQFFLSPHVKR